MENLNSISAPEKRKRSPEVMARQLEGLLTEMSNELNAELKDSLPDSLAGMELIDNKGSINEDVYSAENGGPIPSKQIEKYNEFIDTREQDWSAFDDDRVRKFYREQYGATSDEEFIQAWRAERMKSNGSLAEMSVTLLIHKFLKEDFYVLRTNAYDDYAHGVDNFIVEKKTGTVVCTFDEFLGTEDDDRFRKKLDRERSQAIKHGATITYGLGVESAKEKEGRIILKTVRDVPTFTLPIDKEQCQSLINDLVDSVHTESGEVSHEIFTSIISALSTQVDLFKDDLPESSPVLARVKDFMESLARIQERMVEDKNLDGTLE